MQRTDQRTDTYLNVYTDAVDCDGNPAFLNVCTSIGEFDGITMNMRPLGRAGSDDRQPFEMTVTQAQKLVDALQDSIRMVATHGGR